jgi:hypothetical protein
LSSVQNYLAAGLSEEEKDLLWRVRMVEQCTVLSGSWSLRRGEELAMESENG